MRSDYKIIVPFFFAFIVGCSSSYQPPLTYSFDKERVFPKPYKQVWQNVVDWFGSKEIPLGKVADSTGVITVEYRLPSAEYNPESEHRSCDCGKPGGSWSEKEKIKNAFCSFDIVIKSVDDKTTKVIASLSYKAELYNNEFGSETMGDSFLRNLTCPSTGKLEKELLDFAGK